MWDDDEDLAAHSGRREQGTMNATGLNISADTQVVIDRYTSLSIEQAVAGNSSRLELEDRRTYAVEALNMLFKDNPQIFNYWPRMRQALNEQKRGEAL